MNSIVGAVQSRNSGFQPLDADSFKEPGAVTFFVARVIYHTLTWTASTWHNASRLKRIAIISLLTTSCSFGLSMIVSVLAR
ncbi:hypothetical protein GCM10023165_19380 [Variovorax defluvii]|uniref:Uncharacterized protein n=1 Tax=Variovorax defluvii TaxID=913761 RepID=A0ABP8HIC3_9BURK